MRNPNEHRDRDDRAIEQGFTLIELLIVITILGILAGIVVFAVGNLTSGAHTSACATEKSTIGTALETYKAQNGAYPPNMAALTSTVGASGQLLKSTPADYTIDGNGNITAISGNPGGCS
jgi:general secretion pathway protein G